MVLQSAQLVLESSEEDEGEMTDSSYMSDCVENDPDYVVGHDPTKIAPVTVPAENLKDRL